MLSFTFHMPTCIVFGPGRLADLQTLTQIPKGAKVMIVIGQSGNILRAGYLERVQGLLGGARRDLFTQTQLEDALKQAIRK